MAASKPQALPVHLEAARMTFSKRPADAVLRESEARRGRPQVLFLQHAEEAPTTHVETFREQRSNASETQHSSTAAMSCAAELAQQHCEAGIREFEGRCYAMPRSNSDRLAAFGAWLSAAQRM